MYYGEHLRGVGETGIEERVQKSVVGYFGSSDYVSVGITSRISGELPGHGRTLGGSEFEKSG